jgi:DNA-binding transcriptional ArsR family regulator
MAALADPTRERILDELSRGPRTANEIVALFDLKQPTISRHLRVLRESNLVTVRPEGTARIYALNPAPLEELDRWLGRYRHLWASRLDRLEQFMDED